MRALLRNELQKIRTGEYVILTGFKTFGKAPVNAVQSLDYRDSLSQQSSGEFLKLMHLMFHGEDEL